MQATQRHRSTRAAALLTALAAVLPACSSGSLPGSPSSIVSGGGGGRYSGTLSYRRLGGALVVSETPQALSMTLALSAADQFSAQFDTATGSRGTLQGLLTGTLASGSFRATVLVSTPATSAGAPVTCEGRGEATGSFAGLNVNWTLGAITYEGACTQLVTSATAQATAVSPFAPAPRRANVVVTILPSAVIPRESTCEGGQRGFAFTVEVRETNGIDVRLDSSIRVEEVRGTERTARQTEAPFTTLRGGERRTYAVCVPVAGTYQAFFTATDATGNALRFSSPLVRLGLT